MLSIIQWVLAGAMLLMCVRSQQREDAEIESNLSRRQRTSLPVTGPLDSGVQVRLDIRDLAQQPQAWNLFLLALERFKSMSIDLTDSYYQVAGIHGEPLVAWDGVESIGDPSSGYCPHQSNLFGPWHRPYLALVEQVLVTRAQEVALEFPEGTSRDAYTTEAQSLRLPYWDWAHRRTADEPVLPRSFTDDLVRVTFPNNTQADIANPLRTYQFPQDGGASSFSVADMAKWTHTTRAPDDRADPSLPDNIQKVDDYLNANYESGLHSSIYRLLSQYQPFDTFSNAGSGRSNNLSNLELSHNLPHISFAPGHMSFTQFSAFDFVFFAHHANIDRIISIFQALYPDTWVTRQRQAWPTWMSQVGDEWDAETPLWPFHSDDQGSFWTSNTVRNISTFGYTYPELANNPSNETIRRTVNELYGGSAAPLPSSDSRRRSAQSFEVGFEAGFEINFGTRPGPSVGAPEQTEYAYFAIIDAPIIPNTTYSVDVFLETPSTSTINHDIPLFSPDNNCIYAGTTVRLGGAGNAPSHSMVGNVEITETIRSQFERGTLESLDQESVLAYLEESMDWQVNTKSTHFNQVLETNIRVSVTSVEVLPPPEGEEEGTGFPRLNGWTEHFDVGCGGHGGHR